MAKPKPKKVADRSASSQRTDLVEAAAGVSVVPEKLDRLSLRTYVLFNIIFDAFCGLQLLFIQLTLRETRGLYFFFGLLMVGFLVVCIYDYVYDRLMPDESDAAVLG